MSTYDSPKKTGRRVATGATLALTAGLVLHTFGHDTNPVTSRTEALAISGIDSYDVGTLLVAPSAVVHTTPQLLEGSGGDLGNNPGVSNVVQNLIPRGKELLVSNPFKSSTANTATDANWVAFATPGNTLQLGESASDAVGRVMWIDLDESGPTSAYYIGDSNESPVNSELITTTEPNPMFNNSGYIGDAGSPNVVIGASEWATTTTSGHLATVAMSNVGK